VRAIVLEDGRLRLDAAYPDPKPKKGEALVRVLRAGICGTDLELLRGYKGFRGVPGHEFVGEVEWSRAKPSLVGRRVVGEINVGCGRCARCRRGDGSERHCARRNVLGILGRDGAFAERLVLPARNLVDVGDLAAETAVFVEPLAAALHVLDAADLRLDTRVVVLGAGRLGRLVAAAAGLKSNCVRIVGRRDASAGDADVVVDCTGSPAGFERAVGLVRPLGTIVMKSTCAGDATIAASALTKIVVDETRVVGSRCGGRDDFENAVALLDVASIDVGPLVEATYPLAKFRRAFDHAARPGALKILLDPTA